MGEAALQRYKLARRAGRVKLYYKRYVLGMKQVMRIAGDLLLYDKVDAVAPMRDECVKLRRKIEKMQARVCASCQSKYLEKWYEPFYNAFVDCLWNAWQSGDDLQQLRTYLRERWRYEAEQVVIYYTPPGQRQQVIRIHG